MPSLTPTTSAEANAAASRLLNDLDARQDDLLSQLEKLEQRIAEVFDQWGIRLATQDEDQSEVESEAA